MSVELEKTQPLPQIVKKGETVLFVSFLQPEWFLNEREQKLVLLAISGLNQSQIAKHWGIGKVHVESQAKRITRRATRETGIEVDFHNLTHVLQTLGKISITNGFNPRKRSLLGSV